MCIRRYGAFYHIKSTSLCLCVCVIRFCLCTLPVQWARSMVLIRIPKWFNHIFSALAHMIRMQNNFARHFVARNIYAECTHSSRQMRRRSEWIEKEKREKTTGSSNTAVQFSLVTWAKRLHMRTTANMPHTERVNLFRISFYASNLAVMQSVCVAVWAMSDDVCVASMNASGFRFSIQFSILTICCWLAVKLNLSCVTTERKHR